MPRLTLRLKKSSFLPVSAWTLHVFYKDGNKSCKRAYLGVWQIGNAPILQIGKNVGSIPTAPTMKKCPDCGETMPLRKFHFKNREKGTRATYCKSCMNARRRRSYRRHGVDKEATKRRNAEYRARNRDFISRVKAKASCVDCGNSDHRVLQFDHVRGTKEFAIVEAPTKQVSIGRLKEEIRKCEVRCANCHLIRHY